MSTFKYQRVLIKLSGEAFSSKSGGIQKRYLSMIIEELRKLRKLKIETAVVVGGGNIWRRRTHGQGLGDITADYIGLLATVMNGLALREALQKKKLSAVLQSPIAYDLPGVQVLDTVAARGSLRRGEIVIFAGGTGKPFFTTDTAAVLRARDIHAQVIIKCGPADGVYSKDPKRSSNAVKYQDISLSQAIREKLGIMDKSAFAFCLKYKIPVVVCRWQKNALVRVIFGKSIGTFIKPY